MTAAPSFRDAVTLDLDTELRERFAAALAARQRRRQQEAETRAEFQPGRERWKQLYQDTKIKRNRIVRRKR